MTTEEFPMGPSLFEELPIVLTPKPIILLFWLPLLLLAGDAGSTGGREWKFVSGL